MKTTAWLLAALFAFSGFLAPAVQAQPTFNANLFGLMKGDGKDATRLHFGASKENVASLLGQPTKTERLVDEIEGGFYEVVYYRANKLYFKKNSLQSFELHDNLLIYGKSFETAYRIGTKIYQVTKNSSKQAATSANYLLNGKPLVNFKVDPKPGKSRNINYSLIAVSYPKFGDTIADASALQLLFNANNQLAVLAYSEDND
ncbi:MAG: hypothetical protein M3Y12_09130 [Bacteroidota bacterium]|nr:hypothetical protein [Bacteroidota bacterium]